MSAPLLLVEGLSVSYGEGATPAPALRGVDLTVGAGEIVGIVGESGCGKSTLNLALVGLLPAGGRIDGGTIGFGDLDLANAPESVLRPVRGAGIALVFQDPLRALNPTLSVGTQMIDAQAAHTGGVSQRVLRDRAAAALGQVGIPDAAERLDLLPHEFSGGMRQRAAIAMALLLSPALLVADEPTSALDVTLGRQILALLRDARDRLGTAIILVSHDLDVVAQIADRVVVMYAGQVVEEGAPELLRSAARHPYTRALLAARPDPALRGRRLATIPGRVPDPVSLPPGCAFAPRCPHAQQTCRDTEPVLREGVRCHAYDPDAEYDAAWVRETAS